MPKRRRFGDVEAPQRHLYIIFDDWSRGYSIRRIDLHQPIAAGEGSVEHLDQSIVVRLEAPRGLPMYFAAAFGKIMAMHPRAINGRLPFLASERRVPVVDVLERGLIFGPRPKEDRIDPIYIVVGDTLYALAAGSFELLYPPPIYVPGSQSWKWAWVQLPKPPVESKYVTSYAVHPDGRTIVISMVSPVSSGTFTYDHRRVVLEKVKWEREREWEWEKKIETEREEEEEEEDADEADVDASSNDEEDEDDEEEEQVYVGETSGWEQHGQLDAAVHWPCTL